MPVLRRTHLNTAYNSPRVHTSGRSLAGRVRHLAHSGLSKASRPVRARGRRKITWKNS